MYSFIIIYKNDNQLEKLKKYFKDNYSIESIKNKKDKTFIYFKSHDILPILLIKNIRYIFDNLRGIRGYTVYIDKKINFNNIEIIGIIDNWVFCLRGIVKYVDLDKFRNFKLKEMLN